MKKIVTRLLVLGALAGGWWYLDDTPPTTLQASLPASTTEPVLLSTRVTHHLPLTVSGVVEAADTMVVRAEAAGQVSAVLVKEGDLIEVGEKALQIYDPVRAAEYERATALSVLTDAESTRQRVEVADSVNEQSLRARSADEVAGMVAVQGDVTVTAAYTQLQGTLRTTLELVPRTAGYVDDNRSVFTADGLRAHRAALTVIYGAPPSYLESIRYSSERDEAFISLLPAVLAKDPDSLLLETLAFELWAVLEQQSIALESAESDVLSNKSTLSAEQREAYFALRSEVRSVQAALRSQITAARVAERQATTMRVESAAPVVVLEFQAAAAARQAELLDSVLSARQAVAEAERGVAAAATARLEVRAPVAGTIGGPLVSVGTYVTPGTPLFMLYGAGAREVEVTIPVRLAPLLATGQAFTVVGKPAGVIDRWAPADAGVVSVIVQLHESVPVGTLLTGTLELELPADWHAVPTAALAYTQNEVLVHHGDERVVVGPQYMVNDVWFVTSAMTLPPQVELVGGVDISQ